MRQNTPQGDPPFPASYFERADPSDDARFYDTPRLVTHIDDGAIAVIGEVLGELIPPDATILDLMSSWKSHLPPGVKPRKVIGLGMNAVELAANDQLDEWVVQDLNDNPTLPFAEDQFDIAIITVSIQYVTRPVTLFREIRRVLKPGAALVIIFSNRLFPTKAVRVWYEQDDAGHVALVQAYFELAGGYDEAVFIDRSAPQRIDTRGRLLPTHDPVFVVFGHKIA
ncbi:MAG TPA: methyltransferase domain-containing protein [Thermomicrobiales bacterium]